MPRVNLSRAIDDCGRYLVFAFIYLHSAEATIAVRSKGEILARILPVYPAYRAVESRFGSVRSTGSPTGEIDFLPSRVHRRRVKFIIDKRRGMSASRNRRCRYFIVPRMSEQNTAEKVDSPASRRRSRCRSRTIENVYSLLARKTEHRFDHEADKGVYPVSRHRRGWRRQGRPENCVALSESRNNGGLRFREVKRNPISSFPRRREDLCAKDRGRESGRSWGRGKERREG